MISGNNSTYCQVSQIKITNERRNSLFISDVKYKCAKKPCFSSLSFAILCYLSLLFLMFVFLSGASNTVTGETKSFFSFAKSVSQCCRPQTTACNRNSTRHTGVTQDPRVSSSFFFLFFSFTLQWWQVEKVNPIKLYEENKVIAGFSLLNLLFKQGRCSLVKSVMDKLLCLYNQKKIKPVVDSLWALEEVRAALGSDAWSLMRMGFNPGSTVVTSLQYC